MRGTSLVRFLHVRDLRCFRLRDSIAASRRDHSRRNAQDRQEELRRFTDSIAGCLVAAIVHFAPTPVKYDRTILK